MRGVVLARAMSVKLNPALAISFCPWRAFRALACRAILRSTVAQIAFQHGAEELPLLSIEAHHLHLLDGEVILRPGVDGDARKEEVGLEVLHTRRLLHDVFARQFAAALPQHLHQQLRDGIAIGRERGSLVAARIIPIHEGVPLLDASSSFQVSSLGSLI